MTGCEHRYSKGDYRRPHSVLLRPLFLMPTLDNMGPNKPDRCHLSLVAIFPELGFLFRDTKHVFICLPLSVTLKAQISAFFLPELQRRKQSKDYTVKETANTSSEKMTTVARVIGLKGMPIGKTLVGSLLQPRDHRGTRKKRYFKIVPICLNLSINPTKRSSIYGNHGNQVSSTRSLC